MDDTIDLNIRLLWTDTGPDGVLRPNRLNSFADLCIMDFMARTGLLSAARKNGWLPLLAARRSEVLDIPPEIQTMRAVTQLVGWDDRFQGFEHKIYADGTLIARIYSIGRLTKPRSHEGMTVRMLGKLGRDPQELRPLPPAFADLVQKILAGREDFDIGDG